MHYRNLRPAKNGDKVVLLPRQENATPVVGILYDAVEGFSACNGKLAVCTPWDTCPNLSECLHVDDVLALLNSKAAIMEDEYGDDPRSIQDDYTQPEPPR